MQTKQPTISNGHVFIIKHSFYLFFFFFHLRKTENTACTHFKCETSDWNLHTLCKLFVYFYVQIDFLIKCRTKRKIYILDYSMQQPISNYFLSKKMKKKKKKNVAWSIRFGKEFLTFQSILFFFVHANECLV